MNIEEVLRFVGLSNNETKVYLSLIEYGSSKAGRISKITKIQRSSCYESIKNLVNKGFVSYAVIGKVKFFQATSPKRILEMIQNKEEAFKQVLPKLYEKHKQMKKEGQVRLFKGLKGVKTVLQDIVREGKNNFVFGLEGQLEKRIPEYKSQFLRQLKEKNIKVKELVREGRIGDSDNPKSTKYVPGNVVSPVVTNIYGSKIAIIIWTDDPEAIIIENKAAAESYKNYFNFMWDYAKEK